MNTSTYIKQRTTLPRTRFNRKRYWLGRKITKVAGQEDRFERDFYLKLLASIEQGTVTVAEGIQLINTA